MRSTILAVLVAIVIFALVAAIILRFMPEPLSDQDYLIAGSVASLGALSVLFLGLIFARGKSQNIFFKKRPKQ